jgi:hypothetical protein
MNIKLCNTDLEIIDFLKTVGTSDFGSILTKVSVEKPGLRRALHRLVKKEYVDYKINGRKFLYFLRQDEKKDIPLITSDKFNKALSMLAEAFSEMESTVTRLTAKNSILDKFTHGLEYKPQNEEKIREDERKRLFTKLSKAIGIPVSNISKIYDES